MDSQTYQHLLDRLGRLGSAEEAEALRAHLLQSFGETQRRSMLLAALDERIGGLGDPPGPGLPAAWPGGKKPVPGGTG